MGGALRILVEAYACRPGASPEEGCGWHFPVEFARRGHDVTVITTDEAQAEIEAALAAAGPALEVGGARRPRFVVVPRRKWPLRLHLGWTVGSAIRYIVWLWEAASVARRLHEEHPFQILHHATYGTLPGGTFLWRVRPDGASRARGEGMSPASRDSRAPAPALVLGPLGGGQTAPRGFAPLFGPQWRDEVLRSAVVRWLWPFAGHAVLAARRSSAVLCTNRETALLARRMGARRVERVLDVAVEAEFAPSSLPVRDADPESITVLWLGRIMPRKAVPLAVMALERVPEHLRRLARAAGRLEEETATKGLPAVRLEIVGGGMNEETEERFRSWLAGRPGQVDVVLRGRVPFEEVGAAYERADIFLFPSLRESTGNQLLEAMAYGLPVVCLDHQGAHELVKDTFGIKVPISDMDGTVDDLARAVATLALDPERRRRMGGAAMVAAHSFTWDAKADAVLRVFDEIAP